jgi:Glycosyltransferase sugar-binding region containing DXD motif
MLLKSAILRSEDDMFRSQFVRHLVQCSISAEAHASYPSSKLVPKTIIQFWDNPSEIPNDVSHCMESWYQLRQEGFSITCFDDSSARRFVINNFESRHVQALDACYHPAMRSDYFRLCYIGLFGGCYIDADDAYSGESLGAVFADGRLKLHPLCYDVSSSGMVPQSVFAKRGANSKNWIFYFNNNPLIAPPQHPIILHALERSTSILNGIASDDLPEIQSTTGPGNLTASVVAQVMISGGLDLDALMIMLDWERLATTVWPLSYRIDARNWRLSNR